MDPVTGAAIIGAGAQLLNGVLGAAGSSNLNYRTRQHQYFMLQRQQEYNDKVNSQQMAYQDKVNAENRAYQDKVNAENFAWNSEVSKRARIEAAGYNPYLYDNSSAVSGGSALGSGASLGSGSSSLPGFLPGNPLSDLGASLGAAAGTFQQFMSMGKQMEAQDISNKSADYQFKRMVDNDNVNVNGYRSYFSSGMQSIYHMEDARNQANISSIKAFTDGLLKAFNEAPAVDEKGEPILDGDGNPVSNFSVEQNARKDQALLAVDRMNKELLKMDKEIENLDVDKFIKRFRLDKTMPAELEQIRSSLGVMLSQIRSNNASAASSVASAAKSWADADTENALRRYKVGKASWENVGTKFGALNSQSEYYGSGSYGEWLKSQPDWIKWIINAGRGLAPVFGGAASAGSAYRVFKGR